MLLVNKDVGSDPVVVQVPPPQDVAEAISQHVEEEEEEERLKERFDAKRLNPVEPTLPRKILKQEEFQEIDFGEESYSDKDTSVENSLLSGGKRCQEFSDATVKRSVAQDFAMPSVGSEIPGLDELISSESK